MKRAQKSGSGPAGRGGAALALASTLLVTGCTSIGSLTGAVTGAAAGGGSVNPAVGYAVGIGAKAAVDTLVRYVSRSREAGQQDRIAAAVGALAPGAGADWAIHHKIPLFDDAHGHVTVLRDIHNALAACKEVAFTVQGGRGDRVQGTYVTTVRRQSVGWRWAQAEPATTRWSFLQ